MLAPCEWPHREEPEIWGSARFTITHDTLGACKRLLNLQELTIDGLHVNSEDYDTRQFSLNREISPIASNTVRSKKAARFESQIELPHYRPTILAREETASISVDRDKLMVSFNVYPVQSLLHGSQSPIRNKVLMKHRLVDDQMELVGVDVFSRDAFNRNQPRPIMHVSLSNDLPGSSMRIFGKVITLDYTANASWQGGYPSLQTTLTVPLLPNETSGNTKLIELLLSLSNHQDLTLEQKLRIELQAEQAMYLHPNPIDTVSTHPPINNAQYDVLLYASNEQSNANSSNAGLFAGRLEIKDHPTEPGHRIISFSTDNRTFRVAGSSFDAPEEGSNIFISTPFHLTLSVDTKHGEMSYQSNLDGFIQTSDAKHVVLMDDEKLSTIMGDEFKLFLALYGMALITIEKTVRSILDKDIQCAHGIMKESSAIIPKFSTKDLLDDKTKDALVLDNLFNIDNREYNFPLKGIISITQTLPILNNSDFSAYFTAEGNINRLNIPVQVGQTKRGKLDYQIASPLFLGQSTVPQITLTVPNLQGRDTVAKALFDPAQRDRIQSMELSHPTAKINSTVNGLTVSRTRLASGELAPEESLLRTINLTKTNTESSPILESGKLLVVESLTQSPGKYDCEYHTNAMLPTKHLGSMELTIDHNKSVIAKIESTPSSIDPMVMVPEGTRYQGTLRGDFMLLECWIGDQHTQQLVHLTGKVGQLSGEDYTAKPGFRAMFASAIRSYPDLEERFTALADTLLMVRQLEQEHHSAIHLLREASLLNLEIIRDEIADKCPDPTTTF